jgi:EAL domain-containing protein (putative c-di-GMP-specific phosphodiesterase class I)
MLHAIVSLGRELGLDMIVEGIEDTAELDRARQLQALAGQGYHFARPLPLAEAESFVDAPPRPSATSSARSQQPALAT